MNRPLILENATNRVGKDNIIYIYDYSLDMNIVKIGSITKPFIELKGTSSEMLTKTKIERERDDEDFYYSELLTKTEVKRERDDETSSFLELETKSFVKRERDDDDIDYY